MKDERMPHWLTKQAFLSPEKTAIILPDKTSWTFKQLRDESILFAQKLANLSLAKGDKIAILSGNHLDVVRAIFASSYLGLTAVMLNVRLTKEELQYQLEAADVELVLTNATLRDEKKLDQVTIYTFDAITALKVQDVDLCEEISLRSPFTMMFTSGTTGHPKAVVHTYGNHFWSAMSSVLNLRLYEDDKWLLTLPIFHIGGFSILMKSVLYGMPIYLLESYDRTVVYQAITEEKITIASLVTVMLKNLLEDLGQASMPEKMRCILLGGGSVPKKLLSIVEAKNVPLFQSYGMTETSSQIVTLSKEDVRRKLGSAGKPLFPATVAIDQANEEGIGEIIVKGPMVMEGYYRNTAANQASFQDGWLHTGDLGYIDTDGFLYVVDRRTDMIISGGENIYPTEVENALLKIQAIDDVAVIGITDENWGQIPAACIVSHEKIDEAAIIAELKKGLAAYKIPKKFFYVEALPRNASNKVMRHQLVEQFDNHHA